MKEYTKQITVQAVQWTGDPDEVSIFLNDLNQYDFYIRDMEVRFVAEWDNLVCPLNHWLIHYCIDDMTFIVSVSPDDFQRDYKEVTP